MWAQTKTSAIAFEKRLEAPVEVTWANAPLRRSLLRLAESQAITIFLDRRLDPNQPLDIRIHASSLRLGLEELANQYDWQVSELGKVVYLGPRPTAGKISTLAEINRGRLKKLKPTQRRGWQMARSRSWSKLTEPRRLLEQWVSRAGVELLGVNRVPHDLWDQGSLPAATLLDQITILLAGFDLSVSLNRDGSGRIVKIPSEVAVEHPYRLTPSQRNRLQELQELVGLESLELNGMQLLVNGTTEAHRKIKRWLSGQRSATADQALVQRRYSLTVENQPLEGVLRSLCQQLGFRLNLEGIPQEKRGQLISFRVQNATESELLTSTVSPAGLSYRREGDQLRITQP
ncbi:MAG: hypothetical protein P8N76_12140 [Pirellulaceae bacterium]|nr:hypothetical protein [Pirellulaceae bacterium]